MIAARNASDARNPDGVGDGMGRNVSGDPGDNFHNTQKTIPWAMSATYLRDVGDETPAADYLPAVVPGPAYLENGEPRA